MKILIFCLVLIGTSTLCAQVTTASTAQTEYNKAVEELKTLTEEIQIGENELSRAKARAIWLEGYVAACKRITKGENETSTTVSSVSENSNKKTR